MHGTSNVEVNGDGDFFPERAPAVRESINNRAANMNKETNLIEKTAH